MKLPPTLSGTLQALLAACLVLEGCAVTPLTLPDVLKPASHLELIPVKSSPLLLSQGDALVIDSGAVVVVRTGSPLAQLHREVASEKTEGQFLYVLRGPRFIVLQTFGPSAPSSNAIALDEIRGRVFRISRSDQLTSIVTEHGTHFGAETDQQILRRKVGDELRSKLRWQKLSGGSILHPWVALRTAANGQLEIEILPGKHPLPLSAVDDRPEPRRYLVHGATFVLFAPLHADEIKVIRIQGSAYYSDDGNRLKQIYERVGTVVETQRE